MTNAAALRLKLSATKKAAKPTMADFKAIIGQPGQVRIVGAGARGLRFTVVSINEKEETISLSATVEGSKLAEEVSYTECVIHPLNKKG